MNQKTQNLRSLPKVDDCISAIEGQGKIRAPKRIVKAAVQEVIAGRRQEILQSAEGLPALSDDQWYALFFQAIRHKMTPRFKRVFNGTGVIIHTNLGRSILSPEVTRQLVQAGEGYSNLEFNLTTGERGSRYSLVEELLCELTGAEAGLVVNNNAAAVLISLDTLAEGGEVIVSRGQLVEIGGSFRIPDIMAKSGARLVEVGATNRTHLHDYEAAIHERTSLLLRVHTSNFRIIGFTSDISAEQMVDLARRHQLITMEDLGSGSLIDLSRFGLPKEPTVQEIVEAGVDVVTFSGDKLLGGPQAGVIVGRRAFIDRIKKNPLNRALRIDKFTLASLEAVLRQYLDTEQALREVPTLRMLTESPDKVKKRAQSLARQLEEKVAAHCDLQIIPTVSRVGGGALPEHNIQSWALELRPLHTGLNRFVEMLRALDTPIIGRIENDAFLLDARTLQDQDLADLAALFVDLFAGEIL